MTKTTRFWTFCLALGCGGMAGAGHGRETSGSRGLVQAPVPASDGVAEGEYGSTAGFGAGESAVSAASGRRASEEAGSVAASADSGMRVEVVAPTVPRTPLTPTTVTVTVETPAPLPTDPEPQPQQVPTRVLTAASVGDHDRRGNYLEFLQRHGSQARRFDLDMTRRVRFQVLDARNQPVNDARVFVSVGNQTVEGRTHADGVWDFFPGVSARWAQGPADVRVVGAGASAQLRVYLPGRGDGQDITLRLDAVRQERPHILDLAFLIDVTGSMEDELRYVNAEVVDIVARVRREAPEVSVRVGAVFYRDRTDSVPLQRIAFTRDVQGFAAAMQTVRASGGGDYPEDLDAGLHAAMRGLRWSDGNAARVLVVIADAPPQRYSTQYGYRQAMAEASARGIRLLPVAASGSNREVEFLFRAMGSFTSTPYVYLTDDSGVGNPHLEADTDRVAVEYFNDLLTRLMVSDVRGRGMHEPGAFGASG